MMMANDRTHHFHPRKSQNLIMPSMQSDDEGNIMEEEEEKNSSERNDIRQNTLSYIQCKPSFTKQGKGMHALNGDERTPVKLNTAHLGHKIQQSISNRAGNHSVNNTTKRFININ